MRSFWKSSQCAHPELNMLLFHASPAHRGTSKRFRTVISTMVLHMLGCAFAVLLLVVSKDQEVFFQSSRSSATVYQKPQPRTVASKVLHYPKCPVYGDFPDAFITRIEWYTEPLTDQLGFFGRVAHFFTMLKVFAFRKDLPASRDCLHSFLCIRVEVQGPISWETRWLEVGFGADQQERGHNLDVRFSPVPWPRSGRCQSSKRVKKMPFRLFQGYLRCWDNKEYAAFPAFDSNCNQCAREGIEEVEEWNRKGYFERLWLRRKAKRAFW